MPITQLLIQHLIFLLLLSPPDRFELAADGFWFKHNTELVFDDLGNVFVRVAFMFQSPDSIVGFLRDLCPVLRGSVLRPWAINANDLR